MREKLKPCPSCKKKRCYLMRILRKMHELWKNDDVERRLQ